MTVPVLHCTLSAAHLTLANYAKTHCLDTEETTIVNIDRTILYRCGKATATLSLLQGSVKTGQ